MESPGGGINLGNCNHVLQLNEMIVKAYTVHVFLNGAFGPGI